MLGRDEATEVLGEAGDPRAGGRGDEAPAFLQLFAITGGTGRYVGAKGQATIDPRLGNHDYQIVFA